MNADLQDYKYSEITEKIIKAFIINDLNKLTLNACHSEQSEPCRVGIAHQQQIPRVTLVLTIFRFSG